MPDYSGGLMKLVCMKVNYIYPFDRCIRFPGDHRPAFAYIIEEMMLRIEGDLLNLQII